MKTSLLVSFLYRTFGLATLTFCLVGFDQLHFEQGDQASSGNAHLILPFQLPGLDAASVAPTAANTAASTGHPSTELNLQALPEKEAQDPVVDHVVDQLEKINNVQTILGEFNNGTAATCEDCQKSLANIRYMQCNSANNYLEKEMTRIAQQGSPLMKKIMDAPVRADAIIKPVCMRMSMESRFPVSSKSFRACQAGQEKIGALAFRPCISENYFKLTQNSFDLVSSCMKDFLNPRGSLASQKQDVRAVYALVNIESGFHVNAMSGTGAGGIGQFTSAAISDVNKNELADMRESLGANASPACRQLSSEFLNGSAPMHASKAMACERISLEHGNPVKNMLYTFAYLASSRQALDETIFKNKNYRKKFALPADDLDKIKRAMMVWSHNTGPAGTWTPVKALLNSVYRHKPVIDAKKFIAEIQSAMKMFPASANKTQARRRETSNYFPSILQTLNKIEKNAGGGSCVQ